MRKRINMVLSDAEELKLSDIKKHIGLKTTTDTIRYLISSSYLKLNEVKIVPGPVDPFISPYPTDSYRYGTHFTVTQRP